MLKKYIVKEGDTIHKIAQLFQIRPIDVIMNNPQLRNESEYIYPKEQIVIPNERMVYKREEEPFDCFMEYGPVDVEEDLKELKKKYSTFVSTQKIGTSVMGKPLHAIVIGSGKKEIFFSGGWHANEWLTSKFLMVFIKQLLQHLHGELPFWGYNVTKIFQEIKLFVVPMVNPDGVELVHQGIYKEHPYYESVLQINKGAKRFDHWSSNIRGVDLNHQWPARWEIEAKESPQVPWPRHYSGKAPLTEPEAKAIFHLTKRQNFAYVLAFHSQGQVIYWGYRNLEPSNSKTMVEQLSHVSSYEPIKTADSDGGYKDWFIQETGRPGFTIEVGVGTNPLPFSAFSEIWSNNSLLALEALILSDR